MNAEMKKFAMGSAACAVGVIVALLAIKYGKNLPVLEQASDAF